MSNNIDEKVVEMRFDNKNFESNVQNTLSTLDKLKQKLNLKGASQGLENIQTASNNVTMSGMSGAIDTVQAKFSALQVMGITALANITNAAVDAGKNIVSALTITPVMDGFAEYETQINAVQTILANTQKEGTNIDMVNAALDTLNTYADKTIYNFTEMTRNIGTFTAAGVGLQTSVDSIQGIANLAAVSGSTSMQASTAMYQLSQAIAAGTVKLMDWNSVVNAGMGGQVFQDALVRTSEHLQTGAKAAIEANGSFRESLSTGWLTTEVLTETLKQFSLNVESAEDYENTMKSLVEEGYTEEEAKNIVDMARTAMDAATKVKTFTQLLDTLKEALGSGWTQTWRIIIGDFEEAKALWTEVSEFLSGDNGLITKSANARNALLGSALGKGFSELSEKLSNIVEPAKKAMDTVKEVSTSITDLGAVVDDVILGKFGNGQERFDALTEAGQNYYEVQNKVNETLGDAFRYTEEQIQEQNKLLGVQQETTEATGETQEETKELADTQKELTDTQKEQIKTLAALSDEQLKAKGYTDEQIAAFRELRETAEKLGVPLDTFIDKIDEINGRWLLINSIRNIGGSIVKVFSSIGTAFRNIFDPIQPEQIFNAIGAFHKFTASLAISDETADKLRRTFEGLFAIVKVVTTFTSGIAGVAFKALSTALGMVDVDILSVTAAIGDILVGFKNWFFENSILAKSVELLGEGIKLVIGLCKDWFKAFSETPQVQAFVERIKTAFDSLRDAFSTTIDEIRSGEKPILEVLSALSDAIYKTFGDLFDGVSFDSISEAFSKLWENVGNGLSDVDSLFSKVKSKIIDWLNAILDRLGVTNEVFRNFINDMSWENFLNVLTEIGNAIRNFKMEDLFGGAGENIIDGLVNGLQSGVGKVIETITSIGQKLIEAFCALLGIHSPSTEFFGFGENIIQGLINGITSMLGGLWEVIKGVGQGIIDIFKGIDWGVIVTIVGGVGVFYVFNKFADALNKFGDAAKNITSPLKSISGFFDQLKSSVAKFGEAKAWQLKAEAIKSIAISLGILAASIAVLAQLDVAKAWSAVGMIAVLAAVLGGLSFALSKFDTNIGTFDAAKFAALLLSIGASLILFAATIKILSGMEWPDLAKTAASLVAFGVVVAALIGVTEYAGTEKQIEQVSKMLTKISAAFLVMSVAAKIIGSMEWGDLGKAGAAVVAFGVLVAALTAVTKYGGNAVKVSQVGKVIAQVGIALLALAVTARLIAGMDDEGMKKAALGIGFFGLVVTGLIAATRLVTDKDISEIGSTILAVGGAMALLAVTARSIAGMSEDGMIKAGIGITFLGGIITGLIAATRLAGDKELERVAITLLAMAGSMAILAAVSVVLGLVKPENLIKGVAAVGALAVLVRMMTTATKNAQNIEKTMMAMAIAIGVMAASIAILSFIDPTRLATAAIAMSMVMAVFALIEKSSEKVTSSFATLIVMTAAIAVIAGALALLSVLPAESVISSAVALSACMLVFSGALYIAGKAGAIAKDAIAGILVMDVAILAIAAALKLLENSKWDNSVGSAVALSAVLLALSGALVIVSNIQGSVTKAIPGILAMSVAVLAISAALKILEGVDWSNSLGNAVALSAVLIALSAALVLLGNFGGSTLAAVPGLLAMSVAVIAIAAALRILGEVPFAQIMAGVAGILVVLIGLAAVSVVLNEFALGALALSAVLLSLSVFVIALSAAFLAFSAALYIAGLAMPLIGEGFTAIGTGIQNFITKIAECSGLVGDFSNVMVTVGASVANCLATIAVGMIAAAAGALVLGGGAIVLGAGLVVAAAGLTVASGAVIVLSGAILILCASVAAGITLIVGAMTNLGEFASSAGGNLVQGFADGITNSLGSVVSAGASFVASIGETICGLLGIHSPSTVAAGWGRNTGEGYAQGLTESSGDATSSAQSFIDLIKGVFSGDTSLTDAMGTQGTEGADSFGTGLSEGVSGIDFSSIFSGSNIDTSQFESMMNTEGSEGADSFGTGLTEGMSNIDLSSLMGENGFDMSQFESMMNTEGGDSATSFLSGFNTNLSGEGTDSATSQLLTNINGSQPQFTEAGTNLMTALGTGISNSSESLQSTMSGVMQGLNDVLNNSISGMGSKTEAISSVVSNLISSLSAGILSAQVSFMTMGSSLINALISGMSSQSGSMTPVVSSLMNSLLAGVQSAQDRCTAMGASIVDGLASGMASGSDSVISILSNLITTMLSMMTSRAGTFRSAGTLLMQNFKMGLSSGLNGVTSAIQSTLSSCVNAINSYYSSFSSAGRYLGEGLIIGISNKQQAAYDAGYALGQAAVQGEKDGQDSASPSKLTIKAGKWLGEGLVIGMDRMGKAVYNSGKSMGEQAFDSISSALTGVDTLMTNIDTVQPIVAPVMDMSNMNYQMQELNLGANIDSLVSQPVNSLATIMSDAQAKINASNKEVVGAVNGLRDDLNAMYASDDQEIALYVDAKKLASSIANPMNRQLNILSKRGEGL